MHTATHQLVFDPRKTTSIGRKLHKPFDLGKEETLHVHADYMVVETESGRCACNFWTRSPARDSYYVDSYYILLHLQSIIKSKQSLCIDAQLFVCAALCTSSKSRHKAIGWGT
jgi:hypothetical protein